MAINLRTRYRVAPVQPELSHPMAVNSFGTKRNKEVIEEIKNDSYEFDLSPVPMFPGYTQDRILERKVYSNEVAYRAKTKPTLFQRIEQKKHEQRQKLAEANKNDSNRDHSLNQSVGSSSQSGHRPTTAELVVLRNREKQIVVKRNTAKAYVPRNALWIYSHAFAVSMQLTKLSASITEITPWMYISGADSAHDANVLLKNGIDLMFIWFKL